MGQRNGICTRFRGRGIAGGGGGSGKDNNLDEIDKEAGPNPLLRTYKVLIEYKEGDGKRPSVRLSSFEDFPSKPATAGGEPQMKRHSAADAAQPSTNNEL